MSGWLQGWDQNCGAVSSESGEFPACVVSGKGRAGSWAAQVIEKPRQSRPSARPGAGVPLGSRAEGEQHSSSCPTLAHPDGKKLALAISTLSLHSIKVRN